MSSSSPCWKTNSRSNRHRLLHPPHRSGRASPRSRRQPGQGRSRSRRWCRRAWVRPPLPPPSPPPPPPRGPPAAGRRPAAPAPTPAPPTIEALEASVADDPDNPEAHRALGEALIEAGERDRGIEELDHATAGFENLGNLPQAQHLGEEILRLDPNSVRHRQKQVEYAFKSGDKAKLFDSYLELEDTLLRGGLRGKVRAVYQRVAEHDAKNER